ncbi:MAG: transketolase C-terminal domain-containing protein [Candidatus Azambacteria bacterium]|nr:transketolase C-terminal domain-containing protein [Candidatus Azambacteria bacterium]
MPNFAKLAENLSDKNQLKQVPTRDGFGEGVVLVGKEDPNVVVLCADLADSTRSAVFQKEFPDRFIEIGIAEQNMMNVAAGLALAGKVPFVSTYAVFCPGMNWGQLRVSVLQNEANVKIVGAHSGVSVGPDGMSHQALEDIAIARCLPGLVVLAPCDAIETRKAVIAMAKHKGAVYIRFTREKTPVFTTEETPFEIGKAQVFYGEQTSIDVSIVACGPFVYNAIQAAMELEKDGVNTEVINCATIKPLDEETIIKSVQKSGAVVTVEEHQVMGGLGSAVAECLAKNYPVPMEFIGAQDRFGESGTPEELIELCNMGVSHIKEAVKKVLSRKNR